MQIIYYKIRITYKKILEPPVVHNWPSNSNAVWFRVFGCLRDEIWATPALKWPKTKNKKTHRQGMIWVTWVYPYMIKKTKYCAHVNVCINKKVHIYTWHVYNKTLQDDDMILKSSATKWSKICSSRCQRPGVLYNHLAMLATCDALLTWNFQLWLKNSTGLHIIKNVFILNMWIDCWCNCIVWWTNYFLNLQHLDVSIQFATYRSWMCLWCKLKLTNSRYARGTRAA